MMISRAMYSQAILAVLWLSPLGNVALADPPANETGRFEPWDAASVGGFGYCVAASGDVTVVGAEFDGYGSAYVYRRSNGGWAPWTKLTPSVTTNVSSFGSSVFVSGDLIVVGAIADNTRGIMAGSAFVFELVGGNWVETAKLLASDGATQDIFGVSASGFAGTVFVGAPRDDDSANNAGSVYVFEKVSGAWTQVGKLRASDPSDDGYFGYSMSSSETELLIGAPHSMNAAGVPYHGSFYAFEKLGGAWTQTAKLNSSDGASQDKFGTSVALSGSVAVIGAQGDGDLGVRSGSCYVFEKQAGVWSETDKLHSSSGGASHRFGGTVAMSDGDIVVGAYGENAYAGAAHAFRKIAGNWTETAVLVPSDGESMMYCGIRVAVSNHEAVMGTSGNYDRAYGFRLRFLPYGSGCAGTGGQVPVLSAHGNPAPGGSLEVQIENGLGGSLALLVVGVDAVDIPFGGGCNQLIHPIVELVPMPLSGTGAASLTIPVPASFPAGFLRAQAAVYDPGGPFGHTVTNAVTFDVY